MTEMPKQQSSTFNPADEPGAVSAARPAVKPNSFDNANQPIGVVLEIAGSGSQIALDLQRLNECMDDEDPSIALAGQVGSQVKIRTSEGWLLASVRNQKQDRRGDGGGVIASIDFMGEGREEKLTGKIHSFRAASPLPDPGRDDLPGDRPRTCARSTRRRPQRDQVGTVYPTSDIRAGLYVDAMLGKHFALLGSTGTGKSTSAALILHRICESAPTATSS
jgi:hypothetical protein